MRKEDIKPEKKAEPKEGETAGFIAGRNKGRIQDADAHRKVLEAQEKKTEKDRNG